MLHHDIVFLINVFGCKRVKRVSFSYHLKMECLSLKMNVDSFPHFCLWYVFSDLTLIGDRNFKSGLTNIAPLLKADTQKIH